MSINLVAVCDKEAIAKELEQACEKLGYNISCEIQLDDGTTGELTNDQLDKADAILLVTQKEIRQINDMERFKHRNYFQVSPVFIFSECKDILGSIVADLK